MLGCEVNEKQFLSTTRIVLSVYFFYKEFDCRSLAIISEHNVMLILLFGVGIFFCFFF